MGSRVMMTRMTCMILCRPVFQWHPVLLEMSSRFALILISLCGTTRSFTWPPRHSPTHSKRCWCLIDVERQLYRERMSMIMVSSAPGHGALGLLFSESYQGFLYKCATVQKHSATQHGLGNQVVDYWIGKALSRLIRHAWDTVALFYSRTQ